MTTTIRQNESRAGGRRAGRRVRVGAFCVVLAIGGLAACSDDDNELSAQEQYCSAGESLESSVNSLVNLDVVAEGTNGVETALTQLADDVEQLREAADDAAADDVEALESALDDLESALSAVSGELSPENATAVLDAVSAVTTTGAAVYDTLTDC